MTGIIAKIKTLPFVEVHPEKWSAWIRIGLGAGYALLSLYSYSTRRLNPEAFALQLGCVAFLLAYSCWYLSCAPKRHVRALTLFIFIFFDVAVVTAILASYTLTKSISLPLHATLCSVYFVIIMFYALQNRRSLPLFCGILSLTAYSALYFFLPLTYRFEDGLYHYFARAWLIVVVTALATIVSRRNFFTMNKVISSELRYQKLVHRLPEMLFTLDAHGIFLWANKTSHVLLGIPAHVMCNRNIRDFMTDPGLMKLDKTEFKATFQIKDFNGALKFVDCHLQPLKEDGAAPLFEGIMTDVTDREIALSQREEMVTRLYQYQKMESLGTLAAGMAHDFNNILQTVSDMVFLVEKESGEALTKKRMSDISESLVDAKFLISELLALGRKRPFDFKPVQVQSFFYAIIPQFQNQLGERYSIFGKMPEEPLWIQGEADYLKRVFQNLIGNARDAMPGGGSITIECMSQKNPGKSAMAVIRIRDTGTGIPPRIRDKVFDPFFTTKKPGKGTGLGLALVQRIVSLHNGAICVEKTDAAGTTFRIEIPESRHDDSDIDTKELLLNRRVTRVLILDDDPKIRAILKFFLAEFSYPLCEAPDVDEGIRELRKFASECELVIMDWRLGSDDPHGVIKSLRAIKPELIVIVVSGYPPRPESIKTMNIFKWITKPYDKNQLDLEIQRALYFRGINIVEDGRGAGQAI